MTQNNQQPQDLLLSGFYRFRDASRLLRVGDNSVIGDTATIRRWVREGNNRKSRKDPLIDSDFSESNLLSFLDLMELRFVYFFRKHGVPLQTLRKAAVAAREDLGEKHPFARLDVIFKTDLKKIIVVEAENSRDPVAYDFLTNQHEIFAAVEDSLVKGVEFEPGRSYGHAWRPACDKHPNVIVDPRYAFGKPVVDGEYVPTAILYKQYQAESANKKLDRNAVFERVGYWFKVPVEAVGAAVSFEEALPA